MSRILETASGSTSVQMSYEIQIYDLFDEAIAPKDKDNREYVQLFVERHGTTIEVSIDVDIEEGEAYFSGIDEMYAEKTGAEISPSELPPFLWKNIEARAKKYAVDNGLEAFLW